MGDQEPGEEIGRYAGWATEDHGAPPREPASDGMLGTASRYNAENNWRGTLALLYAPVLFIVITIWLWLRLPAWAGWLSVAVVGLALVIIGLIGPLRVGSMILRQLPRARKRWGG